MLSIPSFLRACRPAAFAAAAAFAFSFSPAAAPGQDSSAQEHDLTTMGHAAGDNATIVSSVAPKGEVKLGEPADMILTLKLKDTGAPVNYEDLTEIHTERIHLLIVDPSLEDYQHVHPTKTDTPGEFAFQFTPKKGGKYLFFSDLLPAKNNTQEYSVASLNVEGEAGPVVKKNNREATVGDYKFVLSFENPQLVQGTSNLATLKIYDKEGKPFDQLEPVMGAFAHMVAFSEDRRHVAHVHPQGKEPETKEERGGPELTFYMNMTQPGYHLLYAQVQIGGKDVFAPFGLVVEPREIPKDVAGIFKEVDTNLDKLQNVVEAKQLGQVHGLAFWVRDVLQGLPQATDFPADQKDKVEPSLKKVKAYADLLDRYGDAGNQAETEAVLKKFQSEIAQIREAAGVKPSESATADAKPLNNANCPVSGMPVGSMEAGAALVHDGQKIGLCCMGCKPAFDKDPEAHLKKALESVKK